MLVNSTYQTKKLAEALGVFEGNRWSAAMLVRKLRIHEATAARWIVDWTRRKIVEFAAERYDDGRKVVYYRFADAELRWFRSVPGGDQSSGLLESSVKQ